MENGKLNKYNYIESRKFYCRQYEKLAIKTKSFKKLEEMLNNGYNLQICGYDGFDISSDVENIDELIKEYYLDAKKPFGHEICLFVLLITKNFPW
jgi:hypothetical protein